MNKPGYKWYTKEEVALWPPNHKKCRGCRMLLPLSSFHIQRQTLFGVNNYCKDCRHPKSVKLYASRTDEQLLWDGAKGRATKKNLPFDISVEDIFIPEYCPVLGKKMTRLVDDESYHRDYVPSLDRLIPENGYVVGNIAVISYRANTIKSNANAEEIYRVARWVEERQVTLT